MSHREGTSREELIRLNLEELIARDNPVRLIDAYVDSLGLEELGFSHVVPAETGSPPYHPGDLLKLYIYGYEHRLRSSRQLSWACEVNIELWWLLKGLKPSYRTIARFRSGHPEAMRNLFQHYVQTLNSWGLLEGKTVGVDSVKLRAQNSKKNNYNEKKIRRQQSYIMGKIRQYMKEMDEADEEGDSEGWARKQQALRKTTEQLERLARYRALEEQLKQSGEKQISTTDADARALALHQNIVEVCYSGQTATDAKHKLLVHYETTNENDAHALYSVSKGAKEALGVEKMDSLGDKGYHTGSELAACSEDGITTYIAFPEVSTPGNGPEEGYQVKEFLYVSQGDYYICPQGYDLHTNGRFYTKGRAGYRVKHYKTKACKHCPVRQACTKNKMGRLVERSEYQEYVDANRRRVEARRNYYRKRQEIVEHPYGTIKRAWGYTYTLLRGMKKVDGELGLIFFCYNLRRSMSILGVQGIIERLRGFFIAFWCSVAGGSARLEGEKPGEHGCSATAGCAIV